MSSIYNQSLVLSKLYFQCNSHHIFPRVFFKQKGDQTFWYRKILFLFPVFRIFSNVGFFVHLKKDVSLLFWALSNKIFEINWNLAYIFKLVWRICLIIFYTQCASEELDYCLHDIKCLDLFRKGRVVAGGVKELMAFHCSW